MDGVFVAGEESHPRFTPRLADPSTMAPTRRGIEALTGGEVDLIARDALMLAGLDRPASSIGYGDTYLGGTEDGTSIANPDTRDVFAPPHFKITPRYSAPVQPDDQQAPPTMDAFAPVIHAPILTLSNAVLAEVSNTLLRHNRIVNPAPAAEVVEYSATDEAPTIGTTRWLAQFPKTTDGASESGDFVAITNRVLFDAVALLAPTHDNGKRHIAIDGGPADPDSASAGDEIALARIDSNPNDATGGGGGGGGGGGLLCEPGRLTRLPRQSCKTLVPPSRRSGVSRGGQFRDLRVRAREWAEQSGDCTADWAVAVAGVMPTMLSTSGVGIGPIERHAPDDTQGVDGIRGANSSAITKSAANPAGMIATSGSIAKSYSLPPGVKTYGVFDLGPKNNGWVTSQAMGNQRGSLGWFHFGWQPGRKRSCRHLGCNFHFHRGSSPYDRFRFFPHRLNERFRSMSALASRNWSAAPITPSYGPPAADRTPST